MKVRILLVLLSLVFLSHAESPVPPQPPQDYMRFIDDLKSPLWTNHNWANIPPECEHVNLSDGFFLKKEFPDNGLLETAYADLEHFFNAGGIFTSPDGFVVETVYREGVEEEAFLIETDSSSCRIIAGDTEGIRRGVFYLEDEMLRAEGPFLKTGTFKKSPDIKRRISRCAFGPIKRLPLMRDELMDTVNYYPDNYLNRLAHEGVNGLWLTVEFNDLVTSPYLKNGGLDAEQRVEKLNRIVEDCLRYGIRTYIFCIEPRLHVIDVEKYPILQGSNGVFFCPSSEDAYNYLYETVNTIFKKVPGLGGMINISHGERGTTCLSSVPAISPYEGRIHCPRCEHKQPWEILHASLTPMMKGMQDASPGAELISWLYMPQPQNYVAGDSYSLGDWVYDIPNHTPENVILQFNFESGVTKEVFNKFLVGGDYWISSPGPSERFVKVAHNARENGTPTSAKIQTGNSHEMATVPYIPVPTLLYQKFHSMKELGVTHTMLSWYFGSYPGLMNKGAGLLSMNSYDCEEDFLRSLASVYWKKEHVPHIITAWRLFGEAYSNYPLTNTFQYYGPMHDGVVWPLLLIPEDTYLSPTWLLGSSSQANVKVWPPSGDRVGECVGWNLTLNETVILCKEMAEKWESGMEVLNNIEKEYEADRDQMLDIILAKAIGIQMRSSYHILRFYSLREEMFRTRSKEAKIEMLEEMERIMNQEIRVSSEMAGLCHMDSRLGYHSEAEGYKYYPAKLEWRIEQLTRVLMNDFPTVKQMILNDEALFPDYTGTTPAGELMKSVKNEGELWKTAQNAGNWLLLTKGQDEGGEDEGGIKWTSVHDEACLYLVISDETGITKGNIHVEIEPRRLWPVKHFNYAIGENKIGFDSKVVNNTSRSVITIPLSEIGPEAQLKSPVRINIQYGDHAWIQKNPLPARLLLGSTNPADLGWIVMNE